MSEIKFTDEEMTSLNDIQVKYRQIQMSMGALKLQQISHKTQGLQLDKSEKDLMAELSVIQNEEADLAKTLNDKYGQGTLDPGTGVFTPNEVQKTAVSYTHLTLPTTPYV